WEVGKVGDGYGKVVDGGAERGKLLMRAAQEIVEQAELVHQLERGGVDGVAAKIAQKVCVLFEDEGFNAGARQEETEHHAGGAASYNAAGLCGLRRGDFRRHGANLGSRGC